MKREYQRRDLSDRLELIRKLIELCCDVQIVFIQGVYELVEDIVRNIFAKHNGFSL